MCGDLARLLHLVLPEVHHGLKQPLVHRRFLGQQIQHALGVRRVVPAQVAPGQHVDRPPADGLVLAGGAALVPHIQLRVAGFARIAVGVQHRRTLQCSRALEQQRVAAGILPQLLRRQRKARRQAIPAHGLHQLAGEAGDLLRRQLLPEAQQLVEIDLQQPRQRGQQAHVRAGRALLPLVHRRCGHVQRLRHLLLGHAQLPAPPLDHLIHGHRSFLLA